MDSYALILANKTPSYSQAPSVLMLSRSLLALVYTSPALLTPHILYNRFLHRLDALLFPDHIHLLLCLASSAGQGNMLYKEYSPAFSMIDQLIIDLYSFPILSHLDKEPLLRRIKHLFFCFVKMRVNFPAAWSNCSYAF